MGWWKVEGVAYKPLDDADFDSRSDQMYISPDVKAPRMAGVLVKIFAWFVEVPVLGMLLVYFVKRKNFINKFVTEARLEESPMFIPSHSFHHDFEEKQVKNVDHDSSPSKRVKEAVDCLPWDTRNSTEGTEVGFRHWTVLDYARAYSSGDITPTMVAERFIASVKESDGSNLEMSFFVSCDASDILKQAKESTLRYKKGEQISVLDGVLVAVKDEIDCLPYPTTGGTKWLQRFRQCSRDACCVERLRQCGAILVGKTNMHELGAGTSGINPHYGATRNPYNRVRISGGSSSGSAAVVAAGLCPVALGVDGGGSVRLPAALCGIVGFKPTFGRIPHSGVIPLNWTLGMVGVLAATVEDAFIVYTAISGQLPSEEPITSPRRLSFPMLNSTTGITDIRLAKYEKWFNDCSSDIRLCCSEALLRLCENYNWKTVEVSIPDIEAMRLAHYLTMGTECIASLSSYLGKINYSELGWDVRVALGLYGAFSGKDYVMAQKMRNRQKQIHRRIFEKADVIVVPTTGVTAYPILDDALQTGELDYINGAALVQYQIAGNFLGLPAVTVPVGYDKDGLPIGIQFIGKPWSEATLIHLAFAMQVLCRQDCRKPEVYYDLLNNN
ncbi:PREDICTED: fatty acid amide hydrolase-like [Tarenaya hassleriana]|uniref:fatty acid amide hydrolase-like n=1 Tax=Tarenaya hassleriana TaxID=28532 RepID=UPI00053C9503|nr:PREDICTED: fatty acid amide hydrolase-like [Tarenaya hassleriana]